MAEYTEGPWFLDDDKFYKLKILNKDFIEITEVYSWDISDLKETKANARLIAAAPDLLEECKEMLKEIEILMEDSNERDKYMAQKKRNKKHKLAIKKAEGDKNA